MLLDATIEHVYDAKRLITAVMSPLDKMATAEKLLALDTGMTIEELTELVYFVEALRLSERHTIVYLRKEETKAPRTIEVDPENNRIFIHLKTHNIAKVGKGAHKRVTHSIFYDPIEPKLVASAIVADSLATQAEIAVLEKFRGSEGIIDPLYIGRHSKKSGEIFYEIITPLYNKGSVRSFIKKNPQAIPFEVKVKIAKDILKGSCVLNEKGYVNRDTNRGNFFVHEENGTFTAVIGDLGGYTHTTGEALLRKPFGPSVRSGPPDLQRALFEDRLTEQDLFSNHVYALGRVFHFIYFEKELPWIASFNKEYPLIRALYKDSSNAAVLGEIERSKTTISAYTTPRRQELLEKIQEQSITPEEHFEFIILSMLSTSPEIRETNSYWLQYINNVYF